MVIHVSPLIGLRLLHTVVLWFLCSEVLLGLWYTVTTDCWREKGREGIAMTIKYASVATLEGLTLVGRVGRVERVRERRRRADIGLLWVDHYRE